MGTVTFEVRHGESGGHWQDTVTSKTLKSSAHLFYKHCLLSLWLHGCTEGARWALRSKALSLSNLYKNTSGAVGGNFVAKNLGSGGGAYKKKAYKAF